MMGDMDAPDLPTRRPDPPSYKLAREGRWEPRRDLWCRPATGRYDCRASLGPGHGRTYCHQPAIAEMDRGRHNHRTGKVESRWYGYCEEHFNSMFRWVQNGEVWRWCYVADGEEVTA